MQEPVIIYRVHNNKYNLKIKDCIVLREVTIEEIQKFLADQEEANDGRS